MAEGDEALRLTGAGDAKRIHLIYLDGLRGLAAISIVVHHLCLWMAKWHGNWPTMSLAGHCVVAVFVVLSGYSLMQPVARSAEGQLVGGWRRYFRRRARRILPAYYAAIFFSTLVLLPGWIGWPRLPWAVVGGTLEISGSSLLAHLLLIQNLRFDWASQINAPLWTVATEWQLYFVFPLVLLPLWRRFGIVVTVVIAIVVGGVVGWVTGMRFDACPWYVGLFALGMAGSVVSFSDGRGARARLARRLPWAWISAAVLIAAVATMWFVPLCLVVTDTLVGVAVMALLIFCTGKREAEVSRGNALLRFLESKVLVNVGVRSYSLYLIHGPLIGVVGTVVEWFCRRNLRMVVWAMPVISVVAIGIATVIFYRLFERPFVGRGGEVSVGKAVSECGSSAVQS
jgi:peptidoglycan/LPS O-acetylase OafA/YrhL